MSKDFELADILSITLGCTLSRRGLAGIQDLLSYLIGRQVWTTQVVYAAPQCKPALLVQHPQLSQVEDPGFMSMEDLDRWLEQLEAKYGRTLPIEPMKEGEYELLGPFGAAIQMREDATAQRQQNS